METQLNFKDHWREIYFEEAKDKNGKGQGYYQLRKFNDQLNKTGGIKNDTTKRRSS